MTTIVTDGWSIAADRQTTDGGRRMQTVDKIRRLNGWLVSGSGSVEDLLKFFEWFEHFQEHKGKPPKISKDFEGVSIRDGEIVVYGKALLPIIVQDDIYALGSGSAYALGALRQGATLKEAIKIASEFDVFSGVGVDYMTLKRQKRNG